MESTKNIFERLGAISAELETVGKNLDVKLPSGAYKAVGEADVLRAVKPLEEKHRVYSYPAKRQIIENGFLENTDKYGNIRKSFYERIEVTYRFVNMDKTDEYVEIVSYGDGIDTGDKSVGKAMTYADKYALMKAYKIVTGEDPDQEASQEYKTASTKKATTAPAEDPNEKQNLLLKASGLGIDLRGLASYYKKPIHELTTDDLKWAIEQKEKKVKANG